MLKQSFPETIEIRKFISKEAVLKTLLPLSLFQRFREYLHKSEAEQSQDVAVDLQFIKDPIGRNIISGSAEVSIELTCQRCLKGVRHELASKLTVQVLDEAKLKEETGDRELDENELDVVFSQGGDLDLLAVVEDELIVSLPIVVYHEEQDCNKAFRQLKAEADAEQNRESPFAELEVLKRQMSETKNTSED